MLYHNNHRANSEPPKVWKSAPRVYRTRGDWQLAATQSSLAHDPTDAHTRGVKPMPEPWVVTGHQQFRRSARISRREQRQIALAAAGLWAAQAWLSFGEEQPRKLSGLLKTRPRWGNSPRLLF